MIVFHDVIIAENPAPAPQLPSTSKLSPWLLSGAYGKSHAEETTTSII
ncbi:hypothetical protein F4555_000210 [Mobiluncus mulieris]|nr:hypothetical protein [Mobiluncus mulieris]